MQLGEKYNIPVIEDAAEGLGSLSGGKKLGSYGDIGIYSFNGNKIITTSGGGALVARNAAWVKQAKFLATQARDAAPHYEHTQIGYNYRLSNISAGIGRGQMQVIDERVRQRRSVFDFYKAALRNIEGVGFQPEATGSFSNRWLSCIVLGDNINKTPEQIRVALEIENIETRPLWKPMHKQPVFKDAPYYGSGVSEKLFDRGLCLPSGSNLTPNDLERVAAVLVKNLQ
jgi:dTDP-4-amino-4,6-dideoxygalactose transaminase